MEGVLGSDHVFMKCNAYSTVLCVPVSYSVLYRLSMSYYRATYRACATRMSTPTLPFRTFETDY